MRFISFLHQTLGFTKNEIKVILFLSGTFLAGVGVRWYQSTDGLQNGREFDYSEQDREFIEKSRVLLDQNRNSANEGAGKEGTTGKKRISLAPGSVDLNTASTGELMLLPGIGNTYAKRIVQFREKNGPFKTVDDLQKVKGIGKKTVEKIRQFLTIGPPK